MSLKPETTPLRWFDEAAALLANDRVKRPRRRPFLHSGLLPVYPFGSVAAAAAGIAPGSVPGDGGGSGFPTPNSESLPGGGKD